MSESLGSASSKPLTAENSEGMLALSTFSVLADEEAALLLNGPRCTAHASDVLLVVLEVDSFERSGSLLVISPAISLMMSWSVGGAEKQV